jgi:hypothetical protein
MCVTCLWCPCCTTATGLKPNCSQINNNKKIIIINLVQNLKINAATTFNIRMSAMSVFWEINFIDIIAEIFKTVNVLNATKMARRSEDVKLFRRID